MPAARRTRWSFGLEHAVAAAVRMGKRLVVLEVTIEMNNRFALDGRNPNSSSGIFWVLGLYDRP